MRNEHLLPMAEMIRTRVELAVRKRFLDRWITVTVQSEALGPTVCIDETSARDPNPKRVATLVLKDSVCGDEVCTDRITNPRLVVPKKAGDRVRLDVESLVSRAVSVIGRRQRAANILSSFKHREAGGAQ